MIYLTSSHLPRKLQQYVGRTILLLSAVRTCTCMTGHIYCMSSQSRQPLQDISPPRTKVGTPDYTFSHQSRVKPSTVCRTYLVSSHLTKNGELFLFFSLGRFHLVL